MSISGHHFENNKSDYELVIHKLQKENLELSNAQLRDYRNTKFISWASFIISIILLIDHFYAILSIFK